MDEDGIVEAHAEDEGGREGSEDASSDRENVGTEPMGSGTAAAAALGVVCSSSFVQSGRDGAFIVSGCCAGKGFGGGGISFVPCAMRLAVAAAGPSWSLAVVVAVFLTSSSRPSSVLLAGAEGPSVMAGAPPAPRMKFAIHRGSQLVGQART
jgi:hypothetical protein